MTHYFADVCVLGGGAAGLFAAVIAASRGRKVIVIEKEDKLAKKLLISGGGRCNFTNLNATSSHYISQNPHFAKSALSQFSAYDFLDWYIKQKGEYTEKGKGQLFCKNKSTELLTILLKSCSDFNVEIFTCFEGKEIDKRALFNIYGNEKKISSKKLIIASGGLSIPKMGASDIAFRTAERFGHQIVPLRPALVPLTMNPIDLQRYSILSGLSVLTEISLGSISFSDFLLFTHRGLSGPAILQISNYWREGDVISVNFMPLTSYNEFVQQNRAKQSQIQTLLKEHLPQRFIFIHLPENIACKKITQLSNKEKEQFRNLLWNWPFKANGSEGYRTAEVTQGGISTEAISSKTMESKLQTGLYFIGECLDVTGQLGGFNFQWAWSSAYLAGNHA